MLSLPQLLPATAAYGYLLLFPLATIEGPVVTIFGGLLASTGYLSVFWVYVIVIAADLAGDAIYYAVGRWGFATLLASCGRYLGITAPRVHRLERRFAEHGRQTLVIGKLTHTIGAAVLVTAGVARMPILEFLLFNLLPTLPKSLLFLLIGYYFGRFYGQIDEYLFYVTFPLLLLGAFLLYKLFLIRQGEGDQDP